MSRDPFLFADLPLSEESTRAVHEISRRVLRPVSELIEGQEPTPIQYDPSSPFNELYMRLGSNRCLKCGTDLVCQDWAPWCVGCYQALDDQGFFQP